MRIRGNNLSFTLSMSVAMPLMIIQSKFSFAIPMERTLLFQRLKMLFILTLSITAFAVFTCDSMMFHAASSE